MTRELKYFQFKPLLGLIFVKPWIYFHSMHFIPDLELKRGIPVQKHDLPYICNGLETHFLIWNAMTKWHSKHFKTFKVSNNGLLSNWSYSKWLLIPSCKELILGAFCLGGHHQTTFSPFSLVSIVNFVKIVARRSFLNACMVCLSRWYVRHIQLLRLCTSNQDQCLCMTTTLN